MTILIFYILLVLGVSFLCSLLESVFLSITYSYTQLLIKKNNKSGILLQFLKEKTDHSLAAILTLNTVCNTIGAAGVGAQVLKLYGNKWVAIASIILTFLILIFSEIIPKTIGAMYWRKIAPVAAYVIRFFIFITKPFIVILKIISRMVAPDKVEKKLSRDELFVFIEIGMKEEVLKTKEAKIIKNVLKLDKIFAEDILTPVSVLVAYQKNQTVVDVLKKQTDSRFSRIPVYNESLDDIIGVVHQTKLVDFYFNGQKDEILENLITPIHVVPHSASITSLLDDFIKRREHLFLVVDEYGSSVGIVTLEDVFETLLGEEIVDEFDSVEDMRKFAIEKWRKRKKERIIIY